MAISKHSVFQLLFLGLTQHLRGNRHGSWYRCGSTGNGRMASEVSALLLARSNFYKKARQDDSPRIPPNREPLLT